jgi:predicted nuclease of predicted toxin-antitoxin system
VKFLADENISQKVVNSLRSKSIDIISLKELTSGVSDETVLYIANQQQRVLITFDSDFSELIFKQKLKSRGVILLKFTPRSSQQVVEIISNALKSQAKIEEHFLIVSEKKIRVLRLK